MYIVDFFQSIVRKSNIAVLIYLFLNTLLIVLLVDLLLHSYFCYNMYVSSAAAHVYCIIIGLCLYIISVLIALSPIGEWILRVQAGCKEINRQEQKDYLEPLFQEVLVQARRVDPKIPEDIALFINDDPVPNAFATGRRTVCLTAGMMEASPKMIKATFAHELGHISHKDTNLFLVISVGNLIVTGIVLIGKILMTIFSVFLTIGGFLRGGSEGLLISATSWFLNLIFVVMIAGLSKLWTMLGILLVNKSSRENEFEADAFAARLGYGDDLCDVLGSIGGGNLKGIFATLASTHPDTNERIARLQNPGSGYYNSTIEPAPAAPASPVAQQPSAANSPSLFTQGTAPGISRVATAPPVAEEQSQSVNFCTHCGAPRKAGAKFCTKCGHEFRVQRKNGIHKQ